MNFFPLVHIYLVSVRSHSSVIKVQTELYRQGPNRYEGGGGGSEVSRTFSMSTRGSGQIHTPTALNPSALCDCLKAFLEAAIKNKIPNVHEGDHSAV
jgi:hypothetical protein